MLWNTVTVLQYDILSMHYRVYYRMSGLLSNCIDNLVRFPLYVFISLIYVSMIQFLFQMFVPLPLYQNLQFQVLTS